MSDKWGRVANAIRTNGFRRWPWATITGACDVAAAADRGQRRIGDRHLLIALSQAEAGVIPRVLATLDVDAADIEAAPR